MSLDPFADAFFAAWQGLLVILNDLPAVLKGLFGVLVMFLDGFPAVLNALFGVLVVFLGDILAFVFGILEDFFGLVRHCLSNEVPSVTEQAEAPGAHAQFFLVAVMRVSINLILDLLNLRFTPVDHLIPPILPEPRLPCAQMRRSNAFRLRPRNVTPSNRRLRHHADLCYRDRLGSGRWKYARCCARDEEDLVQ
jgi:hypothetical protein